MFPEHRTKDISVLTINLTWFCPVRCAYCYRAVNHDQSSNRVLPKEDLIRECRVASKYGIQEYRFSGGEPLSIGDRLFEYADIVYDLTGKKPVVMTSGYGINDEWLRKARGKFSAIAVSVENPLHPLQKVVDNKRILEIIRNNTCEEIPLTYGLTLVTADQFKNIVDIFDLLYENVNRKFMPQLDYPCLRAFSRPTHAQLRDVEAQTKVLFSKYNIIPYYFVYLVGSLLWLEQDCRRININLEPEGNYQIYDSLLERWQLEYRWQNYVLQQQQSSNICRRCEWLDSCKHHPFWRLEYEWCGLRKAIFEGMYEGLEVDLKLGSD